MVLTTGNKSEMSVGYATLYGDMNGGFNPIKDVYKTEVYAIAELRNNCAAQGLPGPGGSRDSSANFHKAPSAELKPNQKDQDSLPPYDVLDDIIEQLVEHEAFGRRYRGRSGHDGRPSKECSTCFMSQNTSGGRRPPGVKITRRNFGRDRDTRSPTASARRCEAHDGRQCVLPLRRPDGCISETPEPPF